MKKIHLPKGRKRNTVTLLLSVALAVVLLALNLLFPYLSRKTNTYIDMTPEGLYTLTEAMKNEVKEVSADVEILFLAEEDRLLDDDLLRYVYIMSRKLSEENGRISVRTLNLSRDPSAVDAFKTAKGSALSSSDVVVHSGGRYKILSAASFFATENDEYVSFNGEYRLATAILSVTTFAEGPYAYFATGHGERYFVEGDAGSDPSLSAFTELLRDTGLRVGKLNLDEVETIPSDCVLLIFCGTETDYSAGDVYDYASVSALKKLDRFLSEKKSVMLFRDALSTPLPNLEDYLSEWGIGFTESHVTDPEASLADTVTGEKNGDRLIAAYPDSDVDAPGYAMIKDIASLGTPPKTVFSNAASLKNTLSKDIVYTSDATSRSVCPLFYAADTAKATDRGGYTVLPHGDRHILAMLGMEATTDAGESHHAYVFAAGSTEMITNDYLADPAFGNGDVMASVLRAISRTDVYASTELGGFDLNATAYGGKWFDETQLSTEGKNVVSHSRNDWDEYAQMTPERVAAVVTAIFVTPVLLLPLLGVAVLRKRKNQ